jgi:hypothetical protein
MPGVCNAFIGWSSAMHQPILDKSKLRALRSDKVPLAPEIPTYTDAEKARFREEYRDQCADKYFRERDKAVIVPAAPGFELLTLDCGPGEPPRGYHRHPVVAWRILASHAPEPVAVNCFIDGHWPAYNMASFVGDERDHTVIRDPSGQIHLKDNGLCASEEVWFATELEIANEHAPVPLIHVEIGKKSQLTPENAKERGAAWRKRVQQHGPKAMYDISIGGYGDCDITKIPAVRRYVREWAKHAGMDDVDVALRTVGPLSPVGRRLMHDAPAFVFLVRCGVFRCND